MTTLRKTLAATLALGAAVSVPAQTANASARDNGDRSSANGPVCVWESKLAADQRDMARGACFTYGYHEDGFHHFYNRIGQRHIEYVTVDDGYTARLSFEGGPHRKGESFRIRGAQSLGKGLVNLKNITVIKQGTALPDKYVKACAYKEKSLWELQNEHQGRCMPVGDYPDITLPQFDAGGWFRYLYLYDGYQAVLYTGKNFTGSKTVMKRSGRIIPPRPDRALGEGGRAWDRLFPNRVKSVKIIKVRRGSA